MGDADLGQFSEGFASWRQILGAVQRDDRMRIFANVAADVVSYVNKGLDKVIAADELADIAIACGLDDTDAVQTIIAEAFKNGEAKQRGNGKDQWPALIKSSAEFVKGFIPPDYLIKGILQLRFLYSFTGKTGSGKTAVVLFIAAMVALGRNIGAIKVKRGRVLYFAGENPDDVRNRWIAMSQQMDFDADTIEVYFIAGRFLISEMRDRIIAETEQIGDIALVIIDTSAAYYEGKEVNSNTEQGEHARRFRGLIALPGGPCVLVNCHPVKNASADNLLPLGAGAFLNEVDGNLTCVVDYPAIEVHWQGKIRGADFEPLNFRLHSVTHERLIDSDGEPISTIVAKPLGEAEKEEISKANKGDRERLLAEIQKDGKASVAEYAARCRFLLSNGTPYKKKTHNLIKALGVAKLITGEAGDYVLTPKGEAKIVPVAGTKSSNQGGLI